MSIKPAKLTDFKTLILLVFPQNIFQAASVFDPNPDGVLSIS
jgi:hypothetical protein